MSGCKMTGKECEALTGMVSGSQGSMEQLVPYVALASLPHVPGIQDAGQLGGCEQVVAGMCRCSRVLCVSVLFVWDGGNLLLWCVRCRAMLWGNSLSISSKDLILVGAHQFIFQPPDPRLGKPNKSVKTSCPHNKRCDC